MIDLPNQFYEWKQYLKRIRLGLLRRCAWIRGVLIVIFGVLAVTMMVWYGYAEYLEQGQSDQVFAGACLSLIMFVILATEGSGS